MYQDTPQNKFKITSYMYSKIHYHISNVHPIQIHSLFFILNIFPHVFDCLFLLE